MITKNLVLVESAKKFQQEVRDSKVDIFAGDARGNTLLHFAAIHDKPEIAAWLIQQKVPVNVVNNIEMSPLHLAAMFNNEKVLMELIKHNAEVNCMNIHGLTPLHYACMRMNRANASKLLNNGASPYTQSKSGLTPYKSSHGDFLLELMDSAGQIQLDHMNTTNIEAPPHPRKQFSIGEVPFDSSLLKEIIPGKMGRIDRFYRGTLDGETVQVRVCNFPKLNAENRENLYDHLVETQLTDHFNILGVIGPMLVSQSEIGIIMRDNNHPLLREVIEKSDTKMQVLDKVNVLNGILSAVKHIYNALDSKYHDMEVSPDTIKVDVARGEGFLEMVTRSSIEGLNTFMPNPEFIAPERLATGAAKIDLNNEHTYSIGALFYYLMKEQTLFEGKDAFEIAEHMVNRYNKQADIYEHNVFGIRFNNELFGVLVSPVLNKRVPIDVLSNTRVFDVLLELLHEKENFLRLYEGKEEDTTEAESAIAEEDNIHSDDDDDDEEEEDEVDHSRSTARKNGSMTSQKQMRPSFTGKRERKSIDSTYLSEDGGSFAGNRDSRASIKSRNSQRNSSRNSTASDNNNDIRTSVVEEFSGELQDKDYDDMDEESMKDVELESSDDESLPNRR